MKRDQAGATTDPVVADILSEALAEFAEHGLAGARVDAIAARTATSKRMIYYHFGSKQGLYKAVLDHAYRSIRAEPAAPRVQTRSPAPSALQALEAYTAGAFDRHAAHPQFIRLVMYENLLGATTVAQLPEIARLNREGVAQLAALLERGRADGSMRPDLDARSVYALIIGQCFHYVSNRHSFEALFGPPADPEAQRRERRAAICDSVLRYVRTQETER
ncbi:MAG: TetR family transcriptional regulator [Burkholderiales bacterium]|nr:TetR family transcriptional regulator [Burkholderiales bacterium]MDE2394252.1 TetR family transcriptional regulator [Burkholderiales bacterium]MDE2456688.1 TetR family transcriptional regulator [Burkholderiales bacterium]